MPPSFASSRPSPSDPVNASAENEDDAGSRKSLGQTLQAERERQGLSRADAAQRLHMSAYQIEALETGDYSRLPKGTHLRGFVRNYAKVLGLAPEAVMPLLVGDAPAHGRPGIGWGRNSGQRGYVWAVIFPGIK